jgi:hypothetical protein
MGDWADADDAAMTGIVPHHRARNNRKWCGAERKSASDNEVSSHYDKTAKKLAYLTEVVIVSWIFRRGFA